jgi:hypothetical protein
MVKKSASKSIDSVAGGHGQIRRQVIETEPADFASFRGLTVPCFSGQDLAKVSRGNPVLVFAREAVIGHAKQGEK